MSQNQPSLIISASAPIPTNGSGELQPYYTYNKNVSPPSYEEATGATDPTPTLSSGTRFVAFTGSNPNHSITTQQAFFVMPQR